MPSKHFHHAVLRPSRAFLSLHVPPNTWEGWGGAKAAGLGLALGLAVGPGLGLGLGLEVATV